MTNPLFHSLISAATAISQKQIAATISLLDEGATIPFISRYRKERTGALDEVQIATIKEQYDKLIEIDKRKSTILNTIEEQGKLTDELRQRIQNSWLLTELEDIYLPFKPKKRTRAEMAREKGLEPLAKIIMSQGHFSLSQAQPFVRGEVASVDDALKGARDIIAEWVNENERARNNVRAVFRREAVVKSKLVKGKDEEGIKYKDYFDTTEPLRKCSSHRLLAMRRGEDEGFLKIAIEPDDAPCLERLDRQFVREENEAAQQVSEAIKDAYKRLLKPSIETEFAAEAKEKADEEAIRVFAENLRQLLLAAPLGQKRVLAIDPGFRTGCKVVCLDAQGNLLHYEAIFPHPPKSDTSGAARKIVHLVEAYRIEAIAIGNGTASRETEQFITNLRYDRELQVFVVSENGASIYSASKIARDEFPDYDVTVRGAISIGRRLIDPLAELVKIDPKSIGIGQYQHDVDQPKLKKSLDRIVEYCVNSVGVSVNTASQHLLVYVSGLGPQLAQNIVEYRRENGSFKNRKQLKKVARMGEKAFEQCAGFLRIDEAENPLDNSAVHPESYPLVEAMARDLDVTVQQLIGDRTLRSRLSLDKYITPEVGLPTLNDILDELEKPGRDPRKPIKVFAFDSRVKTIADLQEGMTLPGIVTNITNFGCFVDIGIKENGLVHISQLTDRFISDPNEVVSLHQHVTVRLVTIDLDRKRIQLSMKDIPQQ